MAHSPARHTPPAVHNDFEPSLFAYSIPWRSRSYHAGATLTAHHGHGSDFAGFASLLACPDPKRIDIRASVRTAPRQWLVRTYLERAAIRVFAIVDLSSSMLFEGESNLRQQVTEFVSSLAWSAHRQGDAFGMQAAADAAVPSWQVMPTFQPGTAHQIAQQMTAYWQHTEESARQGIGATALPQAMAAVGSQRALVFLLSDFYWTDDLLQKTLLAAQGHDVIPVVLRDRSATAGLPAFGWARLRDMETGAVRSWMLRRSLHEQIMANAAQQQRLLNAQLLTAGTRAPLWLRRGWRAEEVSRHLMETLA